MAYRTRRAFRDQFRALALLSQLEQLQGKAASADTRRPGRRAQRRLVVVSEELDGIVRGLVVSRVAAEDLLPEVREYLSAHPSPAATHQERTTGRRRAAIVGTCLCLVAWVATLADVVIHGVTNRPSLAVADWTALALTAVTSVLWLRV